MNNAVKLMIDIKQYTHWSVLIIRKDTPCKKWFLGDERQVNPIYYMYLSQYIFQVYIHTFIAKVSKHLCWTFLQLWRSLFDLINIIDGQCSSFQTCCAFWIDSNIIRINDTILHIWERVCEWERVEICTSLLYFVLMNLRRGSCSTTESKKSCGVIYNWPSNWTDANLINLRSRDVSFTAFSVSSWNCKLITIFITIRSTRWYAY